MNVLHAHGVNDEHDHKGNLLEEIYFLQKLSYPFQVFLSFSNLKLISPANLDFLFKFYQAQILIPKITFTDLKVPLISILTIDFSSRSNLLIMT